VLLPLYVKRRANNGRSVTADPEEPRRQIIVAVLMKARRQFTFIPDDSLVAGREYPVCQWRNAFRRIPGDHVLIRRKNSDQLPR
jgi:hypothetical protein